MVTTPFGVGGILVWVFDRGCTCAFNEMGKADDNWGDDTLGWLPEDVFDMGTQLIVVEDGWKCAKRLVNGNLCSTNTTSRERYTFDVCGS